MQSSQRHTSLVVFALASVVAMVSIAATDASSPRPLPNVAATGLITFAAGVNGGSCHRDNSTGCDLYLGDIDLGTGAISHALLIDGSAGAQWFPALSPDGRFVAYSDTGTNRVIIVNLAGLTQRAVITNAKFPAFSADSTQLFYSTNTDTIRVVGIPALPGDPLPASTLVSSTAATDPYPVGTRYVAFHAEEGANSIAVPYIHDNLNPGTDQRLPCLTNIGAETPCGHVTSNPARNRIGAHPPASTRFWVTTLSGTTWLPFEVLIGDVSDAIAAKDPAFLKLTPTAVTFFGQATWPLETILVGAAEAADASGSPSHPYTTTRARLFVMDITTPSVPVLTAVTVDGYTTVQSATADVVAGLTLRGVVTSITFTDNPVSAGVTTLKAMHISELRVAVNALRTRYGLAAATWTDATATAAVTPVKAVHITELRSALNDAYVAANLEPPAFSNSVITAGTSRIRAVDITELRGAVQTLW